MQDIVPIMAPVSLALFLATGLQHIRVPERLPRELLVIGLILAYLALGVVLNHSLVGISFVAFMGNQGRLFYMLGFFSLIWLLRADIPFESRVYPAALYSGVVVSVVSLYSLFVSRIVLNQIPLTSGGGLLEGFMGGHNPTAGSLGLVIIAFAIAVRRARAGVGVPIKPTLVSWLAILVVFLAALMTKSRGYGVALVITLGIIYWPLFWESIRRFRLTRATLVGGVLAVSAAVAAGAALSSRLTNEVSGNLGADPNLRIRVALWVRAAALGMRSPLFGLGLGTFEQTNLDIRDVVPGLVAVKQSGEYLGTKVEGSVEGGLHVHNIFLELFCEMGLIGMALLAWFFGILLRRRRLPRGGEEGRVAVTAEYNGEVFKYLLIYLTVAGAVAGYTLVSPGTAWLMYFAGARVARQSVWLWVRRGVAAQREIAPLAV